MYGSGLCIMLFLYLLTFLFVFTFYFCLQHCGPLGGDFPLLPSLWDTAVLFSFDSLCCSGVQVVGRGGLYGLGPLVIRLGHCLPGWRRPQISSTTDTSMFRSIGRGWGELCYSFPISF